MESVKRTYAGQTAEERTAERRTVLVEAAFALVAEQGWRALKIEGLCRRAGLNKRYFYESFDGLDTVIGAVTHRLAGDAIAAALDAIPPGATGPHATRPAITAFVDHLTDDPRRAQVLFGAVPAADAAAGHRAAAVRQVIVTVAAEGRGLFDLPADRTVELAATMLVGGTSQALLDWLEGRIDATRDELVDDLIALWQAVGDGAAALVRSRGAD